MKRWFAIALVVAVAPSLYAEGKQSVKPGQWQITVTHEMVGAPFTPPPMSISRCITPAESTDPKKLAQHKGSENCEMKDMKVDGNHVTYKMVCNRNGKTVTGEGEMTYEPDHYYGTTTIEMDNPRAGGHMKMVQHMDGKRTGDCK